MKLVHLAIKYEIENIQLITLTIKILKQNIYLVYYNMHLLIPDYPKYYNLHYLFSLKFFKMIN